MAAMETQPAADAMAHDGVLAETLVILVEAYSSDPSMDREPARGTVRLGARDSVLP